ncbi:MAG: hypothetical protein FWE01_02385 [Firmicutes bacterium]|nr:hypothetical protein [Bacillota bacterium]
MSIKVTTSGRKLTKREFEESVGFLCPKATQDAYYVNFVTGSEKLHLKDQEMNLSTFLGYIHANWDDGETYYVFLNLDQDYVDKFTLDTFSREKLS